MFSHIRRGKSPQHTGSLSKYQKWDVMVWVCLHFRVLEPERYKHYHYKSQRDTCSINVPFFHSVLYIINAYSSLRYRTYAGGEIATITKAPKFPQNHYYGYNVPYLTLFCWENLKCASSYIWRLTANYRFNYLHYWSVLKISDGWTNLNIRNGACLLTDHRYMKK